MATNKIHRLDVTQSHVKVEEFAEKTTAQRLFNIGEKLVRARLHTGAGRKSHP